jgi:hypothetical protein
MMASLYDRRSVRMLVRPVSTVEEADTFFLMTKAVSELLTLSCRSSSDTRSKFRAEQPGVGGLVIVPT